MRERTVPDNGGVFLEDTKQDERINEIRKRRRDPELHPSPCRIGTDIVDGEITALAIPISAPQQIVAETDQPSGEVLACCDCGVYYPDGSETWDFCPQCSSELESFDVAGESQ